MLARRPLEAGGVVETPSFGLAASWILHAATASGRLEDVSRAYRGALQMAIGRGWASLAVPALGTGTGRLDVQRCAAALAGALQDLLPSRGSLAEVRVIVDDAASFEAFRDALTRAEHELAVGDDS